MLCLCNSINRLFKLRFCRSGSGCLAWFIDWLGLSVHGCNWCWSKGWAGVEMFRVPMLFPMMCAEFRSGASSLLGAAGVRLLNYSGCSQVPVGDRVWGCLWRTLRCGSGFAWVDRLHEFPCFWLACIHEYSCLCLQCWAVVLFLCRAACLFLSWWCALLFDELLDTKVV